MDGQERVQGFKSNVLLLYSCLYLNTNILNIKYVSMNNFEDSRLQQNNCKH